MKKYIPYIKKYWYCFILGPLFMVMEASGEFILPYINANIINIGAANGDIPYIIKNGVYMALIALGMLITGVLGANFAIRGAARLAGGVRGAAFHKIQSFSFSNIDDFTSGSLITYITNDVTQIQNFTQNLLRGMFRSPIMLIGAVVMSFSLNKSVAWIILIVIPILAVLIAVIIMVASPRYTRMQEQIDRLNISVRETATNERVIKSFVREEHEKEKFRVVNDMLVEKSIAALKMMMLVQPISALAINVTTLLVVWFAGRQIMVGDMELGTLTAFITYLTQILNSLNFLANIILQGTRAAASDKRISAVLNTNVELNDDMVKDKNAVVEDGRIEFRNVTFRYFKNNPEKVLDNVSLEILPGEFAGIIGSTGSGKTTLVSMIPRLYDADEGEVLIGGKNVRELPLYNLRESISMVLQNNTLFSGTIVENLRWGNEYADDKELMEAAKIAQADSFIQSFKDGYNTEIEHGGSNLSGGQKQRMCIARALLKKPKILILDDSTSAVDTATDASIRRALREKLPDITKLVIAQRINSVIDADKIIVLEHGRIVGCGKHAELLENCPVYAEIYWSQKDREEKENE
ncbi:MAG: ABC transporter ATP-binding protein/permease [Butyrivibrio sp.]|nr:ABC transporter ATP-binding protein/permease [Butyrivibrio sp.]